MPVTSTTDPSDTGALLNFRSLPAYPARGGARLRVDHVHRSGAPHSPGIAGTLGVSLAVDLRHPDERGGPTAGGAAWPCEMVTVDHDAAGDAPHLALMNGQWLDEVAVHQYYVNLYRRLPLDPAYHALFGVFFRALARGTGSTLIFCAAGKDRTGILTAMLGHILGIGEDDILEDYMLSNADSSLLALTPLVMDNARNSSGQILDALLIGTILGVSPDYLVASFEEIDSCFGSLDAYLAACNVSAADQEAVRNRLLA